VLPAVGDYLSAPCRLGDAWGGRRPFDEQQVILPGEVVKESIQRDRNAASRVRRASSSAHGARPAWILGGPLRHVFASLCDKLAMDSRGERSSGWSRTGRCVRSVYPHRRRDASQRRFLNHLVRPIYRRSSTTLLGQAGEKERAGATPHDPRDCLVGRLALRRICEMLRQPRRLALKRQGPERCLRAARRLAIKRRSPERLRQRA